LIPTLIAVVEMVCVIILTVYSLADNERLYAPIMAAILGSILSLMLGYQFLFGLVQNETTLSTIQNLPLGYFFVMLGIIILFLVIAVVADVRIKKKEAAGV
jgi:hypothetical protein